MELFLCENHPVEKKSFHREDESGALATKGQVISEENCGVSSFQNKVKKI